ncbi:MAG TPA: TIGR03118 family protein, partial [Flavisolibacter sp.]|nr:TIGR03118 family protein [Flavisolibacter sp.]
YASEDGVISGWNGGDSTVAVADFSASNAVYKGICLANDGSANFLYLADFKNAKIDVLDKNFQLVTGKTFSDPGIPAGFAPFNIKNIGGNLFVTYAKQKGPDNKDDQAAIGNGYVDIFNVNGQLVKRFASAGTLNSPWGIAKSSTGFGQSSGSILVGNFGDGKINVFDSSGKYGGQLLSGNQTLTIDGLWEITFESATVTGANPDLLYFTAGPSSETHGVFGYLKKL